MKFAVTIFTMLLAVVGGLVFVQYQGYTEQKGPIEETFSFTQEIEVVYRDNSLDVRHHFKNLPEQELTIEWPANVVDAQCFLTTENACKRLNDAVTKINSGENTSQSISYVIPLPKGLQSGKLMKDVFVQLENGQANFSTVHITTNPAVKGSWVTGLPLIGYQQLSLVNYSMFSGKGNIEDLYWQRASFTHMTAKDSYSFYSNTGITTAHAKQIAALKEISEDHVSIVKIKNVPKEQGYRILFVEDTNPAVIQRQLTLQQLEQMYTFKQTPSWLKQVVGSIVVGESIGLSKSQQVLEQLQQNLDEAQYDDFKERVVSLQGQIITPEILDEHLSLAIGTYTKFISLNVGADFVYPFVYNDERPIMLNGKEQKKIHVLLKDNRVLYPADALLQSLGYKTSEGANGYYVNNDTRAYRFPADEHDFYVFNQRRFNISVEPFDYIGPVRYIEEGFIQRVFLLDIEKTDNKIVITTTGDMTE